MKKILYFFLLVIFLKADPAHAFKEKNCRYDLSICAIFQNEAQYLKEWIEYHQMLGVQHFYLYNNNSFDDYLSVLDPYIEENVVELTDWPSPLDEDWTKYQQQAYNHCLERCREQTRWLAVIDLDEFLLPHHHDSLLEFLKPYEKKGGVHLNWVMFGTAGYWEIPEDQLMIECLDRASGDNGLGKTIIKPHRCSSYKIHGPAGYTKKKYKRMAVELGEAQINHYWTRNEKFLREVKAPRRERYEKRKWTEERIQWIIEVHNRHLERSIQRFIFPLKERMFGDPN